MKNIFKLLTGAALLGAVASCSINETPVFEEQMSFVYVDEAAITCKEDAGTIRIPIKQAAVKPYEAVIVYQANNGKAELGKDFALKDDAAVLTFDGVQREAYIDIDIIDHPGEFTNTMDFAIQLISVNNHNLGDSDICKVTIKDNDHPLADILGTYTATGINADDEEMSWTTTIKEDPEDLTVVWIDNLSIGGVDLKGQMAELGFDYDVKVYGNVSEDHESIAIPLGQKFAGNKTVIDILGWYVCLIGGEIVGEDIKYITEGNLLLKKTEEGVYKANMDLVDMLYDNNSGKKMGFWDVTQGAVYTKNK